MSDDRAGAPGSGFGCVVSGCPCHGTLGGAAGWLCPQHYFARDPADWPRITGWLRSHLWMLNLQGRVASLDPYDWSGPLQRWKNVATYCQQHERIDLAPGLIEIERIDFDPVTRKQVRTVRQRDERVHRGLWLNRLAHTISRECWKACETTSTSTTPAAPAHTQGDDLTRSEA
jgi:hypothetical protein